MKTPRADHSRLLSSVQHPFLESIQAGARGGTSVNIQLHRLPTPTIDAWVWHISEGETLYEKFESVNVHTLREVGWEILDAKDTSFPFLPLISQLADTVTMMLTNTMHTLAKAEAIATAEQFPVILAFAHQDTPPVLPGPPTQLGELGIIFDERKQYQIYTIQQLGEEGALLCQRLRASIAVFLSLEVTADERGAAWGEAQAAARELAERYWYCHQQTLSTGEHILSDGLSTEGALLLPSTRRTRRDLPPATTLLAGEPHGVAIPTDPVTQALMRSLLDGTHYTHFKDLGYAEHVPLQRKGQQLIRITIQPGSGEEWESVLQSLKMLGDEVVDTFCALLAIAIDVTSGNITDSFFLDVDDILLVCQRKKSHRTFTSLQRLRVVEHLRTLERVHITASQPGQSASSELPIGKANARKRRSPEVGTVLHFDSTVLDLLGTIIGEYRTLTGEPLWERREVKIGRWALLAPSLSPQTALMLRKVLGYHAQRQRHEKRIGRWLTLQFQVPSRHNARSIECSTQYLLEQSGIKANPNVPTEVRVGIEEAVEQLLKDNIIGAYQRVIVLDMRRSRAMSPFESYEHDEPGFGDDIERRSADSLKTIRQRVKIESEEAGDIYTCIKQRARGWWTLYAKHVWWRFEPPLPPHSLDRKLLTTQQD